MGLGAAADSTLIVDSVHGDVHLTATERAVLDTASFQRLRHLKQLQMAHVTYPNATHTRFAHSIGVLGIMEHIIDVADKLLNLSEEKKSDIRLAGLLHDVGHYPYSHLMEGIDKVVLTEQFLEEKHTIDTSVPKYPKHTQVGKLILTSQKDLIEAIGGPDVAKRVSDLFTRDTTDPQLSKLIHSSLDMDRLDYLLRDAQASGVPYGRIDINYILNNFRTSESGMLGVDEKALAAVEHFLMARFFMHKAVYYHKTTYGIEEACRQLLRRIRNAGLYNLPKDGDAIAKLVKGPGLGEFTDAYVDRIVEEASTNQNPVISALANCIRRRRPPKLLLEMCVLQKTGDRLETKKLFDNTCKLKLAELSKKHGVDLGRFLVCETVPLTFEERGPLLTVDQARKLQPEEREELIKVFTKGKPEPVSVVNIPHSILHICASHFYQAYRLYFVPAEGDPNTLRDDIQGDVNKWGIHTVDI